MNNLTKWAVGLILLSLIALVWGYNYQDSHKTEAFGAFLGANATAYRVAGYCQIGGAISLLIGIGLLIGGLVQGGRQFPSASKMLNDASNQSGRISTDDIIGEVTNPKAKARLEVARTRLNADPLDVKLLLEYADALRGTGQIRDAIVQLEKVLIHDETNISGLEQLADLYELLEQYDSAASQYERIMRFEKVVPGHYLKLAVLQSDRFNNVDKALETIQQGLTKFPKDISLLKQYCKFSNFVHDKSKVISICRQILSLNPDDIEIMELLANNLESVGDQNAADVLWNRLRNRPKASTAIRIKGTLRRFETGEIKNLDEIKAELKSFDIVSESETTERADLFAMLSSWKIVSGCASDTDRRTLNLKLINQSGPSLSIAAAMIPILLARISEAIIGPPMEELDKDLNVLKRFTNSEAASQVWTQYHLKQAKIHLANHWMDGARVHLRNASANIHDTQDQLEAQQIDAEINSYTKRRTRRTIVTVFACIIGLLAVYMGFGFLRGGLSVTTDAGAELTIIKAGKVIFAGTLIDGKYPETTLWSGSYEVSIKKDGYRPATVMVAVPRNKSIRIDTVLAMITYTLIVRSDPTGASVLIDGKNVGITPLELPGVQAIPHNIYVSKSFCSLYNSKVSPVSSDRLELPVIHLQTLVGTWDAWFLGEPRTLRITRADNQIQGKWEGSNNYNRESPEPFAATLTGSFVDANTIRLRIRNIDFDPRARANARMGVYEARDDSTIFFGKLNDDWTSITGPFQNYDHYDPTPYNIHDWSAYKTNK